MSELNYVKDLANKLLEDHGDKGVWDKWAKRFVMGIDLTKEGTEKALRINEKGFVERSGRPDTRDAYFELINEANSYYVSYISRSACCRAAIAWANSTTAKPSDKADLLNEVAIELGQAQMTLDCMP